MTGSDKAKQSVLFADFRLDRRTGELFRHDRRILLPGQPVRILTVLLERPGELVTQEDLVRVLWGEDTHVDFEQGLRSAVLRLRAALEDSSSRPRFIETVPRKGYRYIGPPPDIGVAFTQVPPGAESGRFRRVVLATAALVVLAGAAAGIGSLWHRAAPPFTLAVLPLQTTAAQGEDAVFARELTTEIVNELTRLDPYRLKIVSESLSSRYRTAREIRYAMEVDYVVEGTVSLRDGRARVSVRLVPAEGRTQRWGETFDVDAATGLAAQRQIAEQIGEALPPALKLPPNW